MVTKLLQVDDTPTNSKTWLLFCSLLLIFFLLFFQRGLYSYYYLCTICEHEHIFFLFSPCLCSLLYFCCIYFLFCLHALYELQLQFFFVVSIYICFVSDCQCVFLHLHCVLSAYMLSDGNACHCVKWNMHYAMHPGIMCICLNGLCW